MDDRFPLDVFDLDAPIHIIGYGARVPYSKPAEKQPMIDSLIDRFFTDDVPDRAPNRTVPHVQFGLVCEFDGNTGIGTYMMGVQADSLDDLPKGMRGYTLPAGKYARVVFSAPDKDTLVTQTIDTGYERLYGWLAVSAFQEAEMLSVEAYPADRFEVRENPEMEIWTRVVARV